MANDRASTPQSACRRIPSSSLLRTLVRVACLLDKHNIPGQISCRYCDMRAQKSLHAHVSCKTGHKGTPHAGDDLPAAKMIRRILQFTARSFNWA